MSMYLRDTALERRHAGASFRVRRHAGSPEFLRKTYRVYSPVDHAGVRFSQRSSSQSQWLVRPSLGSQLLQYHAGYAIENPRCFNKRPPRLKARRTSRGVTQRLGRGRSELYPPQTVRNLRNARFHPPRINPTAISPDTIDSRTSARDTRRAQWRHTADRRTDVSLLRC